jgi:hypothetical protein
MAGRANGAEMLAPLGMKGEILSPWRIKNSANDSLIQVPISPQYSALIAELQSRLFTYLDHFLSLQEKKNRKAAG